MNGEEDRSGPGARGAFEHVREPTHVADPSDAGGMRRRALLDQASDALFSTNLDGTILDSNRAAGVALGIDLGHGGAETLMLCVGEADAPSVRRVLDTIALTASADLELHLRSPGGRVLWAVRARFSREAHAVLWAAASVTRETTDLRRVVLDKTELLERERQRSALSQAASDAKDRLLAIVGEDSSATLNTVLGWTRMLRREVLDTAARDMALAVIEGNVERHLTLLSDLLEVARLVDGDPALDLQRVELVPILEEVITTTAGAAAERGIVVVRSSSPPEDDDEASTLGDKRNVERLVRAAIEGVVDSSARGDHVTVDTQQDQDFFTLRVTSGGSSSSPVPSVAPSRAPAPSFHPTGQLAFLLVERIARIHGGSATQSADRDGRRFIEARLPRFDGSPIPPSPRVERRLQGLRVLVFAPNHEHRELAVMFLRENGANVLSARDAATTAAAVSTFGPDVVVADVAAADDEGDRLFDRMRASSPHASLAIVGLASAPEPTGHGDGAPAGPDAIVRPPFDADTLVQAVLRSRATTPRG